MTQDGNRPIRLSVTRRSWPLKEPFAISTGTQTAAHVVTVALSDVYARGIGEAKGVSYLGESQDSIIAQIESVRDAVEAGVSRQALLELLPAGGARNALDAALWDLEAKRTGVPAWKRAGVAQGSSLVTAVTIGLRSPEASGRSAQALADHQWIKLKVDRQNPIEAVAAVRAAAPESRLIVDANQAWSVEDLRNLAPKLAELGVDLLEQPVPADADADLLGYDCPVPLCADEALQTIEDLAYVAARYAMVNIKLDKTGGLTAALRLADVAENMGLTLMVGCMVAGSVAMAPAMILGQRCAICDLDGPLLQAEDWPVAIRYDRGIMQPPWPALWG